MNAPDRNPFALVGEMEAPLSSAVVFADAIAMVAETVGDQEGAVFQRLAWAIKEHCKTIECHRGKLFRMLHPNRAHFEEVGWPGDKGSSGEVEEPPKSCDIAALRAAVAAIVSEFDVPLPAGDAALVEAARRLCEMRARFKALYDQFAIDMDTEAAEIIPHADPLDNRLDDFLIETEPQTLAGAAVMLRHALNENSVLLNNGGYDLVANVLALIEREIGTT